MKIALFGGSFNPVHQEHVNIVKAALREFSLDRVLIMPAYITPDKLTRSAEAYDRLAMCRLAFGNIAGVEVSDYEIKKGGVSYTYLTCREFRLRHPDDELYFILGADMLESFPKWRRPQEILKCVNLLVCARGGEESLKPALKAFCNEFNFTPSVFGYVGKAVSSTRVRAIASLGEPVAEYTGEKVADYVYEKRIYLLPELYKVKKYLTGARWQHTLRVAVMAAENCRRAGVDEQTAITAAALHDCAKYLPPSAKELKGFVCPSGVPEPVVHQYAGAYVAEKVFGVKDKTVLDAIKYHASGRENMSPLEKLLYLCDMLEEGRNFAGVEALRQAFARSIDGGLFAALGHQVDYLLSSGGEIYPLTLKAFEYYEKELKNGQ